MPSDVSPWLLTRTALLAGTWILHRMHQELQVRPCPQGRRRRQHRHRAARTGGTRSLFEPLIGSLVYIAFVRLLDISRGCWGLRTARHQRNRPSTRGRCFLDGTCWCRIPASISRGRPDVPDTDPLFAWHDWLCSTVAPVLQCPFFSSGFDSPSSCRSESSHTIRH